MAALGPGETAGGAKGNNSMKDFERDLPTDLEELRRMKYDLLLDDASFGYSYRVSIHWPMQSF